jgi:aspartate-semialdehyde dehydrogenase
MAAMSSRIRGSNAALPFADTALPVVFLPVAVFFFVDFLPEVAMFHPFLSSPLNHNQTTLFYPIIARITTAMNLEFPQNQRRIAKSVKRCIISLIFWQYIYGMEASMSKYGGKPNLAIVGATGLVGGTFLKVLEQRGFPHGDVYMMASAKSAGKTVTFDGQDYVVEELTPHSFDKPIDIALFSAGGETSRVFAPIAAEHGATVVDNSSQWRENPDIPLVVPEVNPDAIDGNRGIIANPNCSTIQAVVALKPLYDRYGIKRIVYSTYQAVSGSGLKGIRDLREGLQGNDITQAYPHPIAGNCLPHIDVFTENGYTKEELKMINETRKILGDERLAITVTTVRVPVFESHSEAINVEFEKPFGDISEVRELLAAAPGIVVRDDPQNNVYPLAREAAGRDEVFVGRIRRDFSVESGVNLWCVADNVRKGAATNAVQIAELLIR